MKRGKDWGIKADDTWLSPKNSNAHLIANMTNKPNTDSTVELARKLRIKADMIQMGEKIEYGSDSSLMREAAEALTSQNKAHRDRLLEAVEGMEVEMIPELEGADGESCQARNQTLKDVAEIIRKEFKI